MDTGPFDFDYQQIEIDDYGESRRGKDVVAVSLVLIHVGWLSGGWRVQLIKNGVDGFEVAGACEVDGLDCDGEDEDDYDFNFGLVHCYSELIKCMNIKVN